MTIRHGMWFATERPLDRDELAELDHARLQPCIDVLHDQIAAHLNDPAQNHCQMIALHGGLGQGKSTVLNAVIAKVKCLRVRSSVLDWPSWFSSGASRQPDLALLDVSLLKPDHLDRWLLSTLLMPRIFYGLLRLLATLLILGWFLWWGFTSEGMEDAFWLACTWTLTLVSALLVFGPFTKAVGKVKGDWESGYLERAVYGLAQMLDVLPDLICVDDLDRASLDQQRAVLRALARHGRAMRRVVVVCFDESELLGAEPSPEAPEELLRKLIQLTIRVPARTREDAALLAISATRQWAGHNRASWPRLVPLVQSPRFVGALARAMLVTQSVGPRRGKGLLAETMMAAQQRGVDGTATQHADDLCALLLVTALNQAAPQVMRNTEAMLAVLERSNEKSLDTWLALPESAHLKAWFDKKPPQAMHLRRLVALADAHLPAHSGWRGLLAMQSRSATPITSLGTTPSTPTAVVDSHVKLLSDTNTDCPRAFLIAAGALLDRAASGYDALSELGKLFNEYVHASGRIGVLVHFWTLALCVMQGKSAIERLRVHEQVLSLLDTFSKGDLAEEDKLEMESLTLRECLCDRELVELMPTTALKTLLSRHGARHRFWPLIKGLSQTDKEIEAILWQALADPAVTDGQRDMDLTAVALENMAPQKISWVANSNGPEVFERAWPPLRLASLDVDAREQLRTQLIEHLTVLRSHMDAQRLQTSVISDEGGAVSASIVAAGFAPDALKSFFTAAQSWVFSAEEWLDLLSHLLADRLSGVENALTLAWAPGNWSPFGMGLPLPLRSAQALDGLETSTNINRDMTAFCLSLFVYRDPDNVWLARALSSADYLLPAGIMRLLVSNEASVASVWSGSAALNTRLAGRLIERAAPLYIAWQTPDSVDVKELIARVSARADAEELVPLVMRHLPTPAETSPQSDTESPL